VSAEVDGGTVAVLGLASTVELVAALSALADPLFVMKPADQSLGYSIMGQVSITTSSPAVMARWAAASSMTPS
jgi:hypothetical protein